MNKSAQKTFEKILKFFANKILKSDCDTTLYYAFSDYGELFNNKQIAEIIDNILSAIENNYISYNIFLKCPVFHLSNSIDNKKNLYVKRIIPAQFISTDKSDTEYIAYIFNCPENIIKRMSENDYKIASHILNFHYLV